MMNVRLVTRPAFEVIGKKTWIPGQDNEAFGRFWKECATSGLFETFKQLTAFRPGPQTGGATLGVSCVEQDPANRAFYFMIGVEKPEGDVPLEGLEIHRVPASQWAVFPCPGQMPEALVTSEIYAFSQWLPASGFVHAPAPEMEVYPPETGAPYCEFWLPIAPKEGAES